MLPVIPDDILIPTEPLGTKQLAALYKRDTSTIQRAFNDVGVHEAIGQRVGREYNPEQLLIIFWLYFPPSKYYKGFLWLEKNGYMDTLILKYGLEDFKKNRKRKNDSNNT